MDSAEWLAKALKDTHKSQKGLAAALGISESAASRLVNGLRKLRPDEIQKVSAYLGVPFPQDTKSPVSVHPLYRVGGVPTIPVRVVLATGLWRERGAKIMDQTQVPASPDPRLTDTEQYACRIEGPEYGHLAGQYAVCVPYQTIRLSPHDADVVHVVRRKADLEEHSLKIVQVRNGAVLLASTQGNTPAVILANDTEIAGLVIGYFKPVIF